MNHNPDSDGWVNPRRPLTRIPLRIEQNPDLQGWVNPRRPLTAMTGRSGGLAGDVAVQIPSRTRHTSRRCLQRRPPVANSAASSLLDADLVKPSPSSLVAADLVKPSPSSLVDADLVKPSPSSLVDADLAVAGDGLAGWPEESVGVHEILAEKSVGEETVGEESVGDESFGEESHFSGDTIPPALIALDPELWAREVAAADRWMEEMVRKGRF